MLVVGEGVIIAFAHVIAEMGNNLAEQFGTPRHEEIWRKCEVVPPYIVAVLLINESVHPICGRFIDAIAGFGARMLC